MSLARLPDRFIFSGSRRRGAAQPILAVIVLFCAGCPSDPDTFCTSDSQCPVGKACLDGLCHVPPPESEPEPDADEVSPDADAEAEVEEEGPLCIVPEPYLITRGGPGDNIEGGYAIYGNTVAYIDIRFQPMDSLHLFDTTTRETSILPVRCSPSPIPGTRDTELRELAMNDNYLAYGCLHVWGPTGTNIYTQWHLHRFADHESFGIDGLEHNWKLGVALGDAFVAWSEPPGPNPDVLAYDLEEGEIVTVAATEVDEYFPKAHGSKLVYTVAPWTNRHGDIQMTDMDDGSTVKITDDEYYQWGPRIHGDLIVWTDTRNGGSDGNGFPGAYHNADIYMHRISTGETTQITTDPANQEMGYVHGQFVAWMDLRNGHDDGTGRIWDADIYLHNLESGAEIRITTMDQSNVIPMMSGTTLIWTNRPNASRDPMAENLYMIDISEIEGCGL